MSSQQPAFGTVAYANWSAQQIVQNETNQRNQAGGYGAVAASPSTGAWGWSYNCGDADSAIRTALGMVPAPDRVWLYWAQHQTIVLLRAQDGSFHAGADADGRRATAMALGTAGSGATLLLCFETARGANMVMHPTLIS